MSCIEVHKRNEAFVMLECDDQGILMEIADHYTFYAPGYKFVPSFRNKIWDGKIRIFNRVNGILPYGLVNDLIRFSETQGYKLKVNENIFPPEPDTPHLETQLPFQPRDYQIQAWHHGVVKRRAILVSPTGSGKSLIIYLLMRYFLATEEDKFLIVVPTTSLVEQMYKDFQEYSKVNGFPVPENVHRIYSGKDKIMFEQRVVITTWQSAILCPPDWFRQFGGVIGDEAHTFKAKSLNKIMGMLENASYRIGTTGTLDGTKVHELVLTGHFGDPYHVTSTKELIENDTLAQLKVSCLVLKYSDEVRKAFGKKKYQEEIDFLVSNEARNRFICNLTLDQTGNSLVLYNLVAKHGKPLFEQLQARAGDRKVFFVSGAVSVDQRERIREITEQETNAIIVASMGTFSTGINIRNLNNIVFAAPTKSQIRVLQSIGRGLRKGNQGKPTKVYDISDNLSWKSRKNYTMNHAVERVKIYEKQNFDFSIFEVEVNQ